MSTIDEELRAMKDRVVEEMADQLPKDVRDQSFVPCACRQRAGETGLLTFDRGHFRRISSIAICHRACHREMCLGGSGP